LFLPVEMPSLLVKMSLPWWYPSSMAHLMHSCAKMYCAYKHKHNHIIKLQTFSTLDFLLSRWLDCFKPVFKSFILTCRACLLECRQGPTVYISELIW